jgi:multimeric flavodoxin WrbA
MGNRLLLHDLQTDDAKNLLPRCSERYTVFPATPAVRHCTGCFGCWLKTPGTCMTGDRGADFVSLLSLCDELVLISRLVFGGLSPDVKAVLDRSIGFVSPFFRDVDGEMHHVKRFANPPDFRYLFYASAIPEQERETAKKLAAANSLNLGSGRSTVLFYMTARECVEALA